MAIGITLITDTNEMSISGSDIWISDFLDDSLPIAELSQNRVVPVIPMTVAYQGIFSEFDPMKFEGNAFIFEKVDQFMMFEKLIRALENMRYAGDKRMLLANVEKNM